MPSDKHRHASFLRASSKIKEKKVIFFFLVNRHFGFFSLNSLQPPTIIYLFKDVKRKSGPRVPVAQRPLDTIMTQFPPHNKKKIIYPIKRSCTKLIDVILDGTYNFNKIQYFKRGNHTNKCKTKTFVVLYDISWA